MRLRPRRSQYFPASNINQYSCGLSGSETLRNIGDLVGAPGIEPNARCVLFLHRIDCLDSN